MVEVQGPVSRRPQNAPRAGAIVADKYRVERMLGSGGMGFVFAATTMENGERVAIKMLLPELASDGEMVERFLREARAARKITSRHSIRVFDTGVMSDGAPFFVMEYLEGRDLGHVLEERGSCSVPEVVDWVLQGCEAIAEAHAAKTVHRDLKPSNLYLTEQPDGPCIKVLDFGVSKSIASDSMSMKMTKTSAMLGTPLYMSPEQLTNAKDVDERADIWSIGVILYELMSGKVPFDAPTLPELSVLVLGKTAPVLSAPGIPPALANIIATCLMRERDARFKNLAELADLLAPFGTESARRSTARIVETLGLPASRTSLRDSTRELANTIPMGDSSRGRTLAYPSRESGPSSVQREPESSRGSRRSLVMLAAAGLFVATLAVVVGSGSFLRNKDASTTTAPAADKGRAIGGDPQPVAKPPPEPEQPVVAATMTATSDVTGTPSASASAMVKGVASAAPKATGKHVQVQSTSKVPAVQPKPTTTTTPTAKPDKPDKPVTDFNREN